MHRHTVGGTLFFAAIISRKLKLQSRGISDLRKTEQLMQTFDTFNTECNWGKDLSHYEINTFIMRYSCSRPLTPSLQFLIYPHVLFLHCCVTLTHVQTLYAITRIAAQLTWAFLHSYVTLSITLIY
ncbi:hypothetical protein FKM82_000156 [Ascaphus truei]